MTAFETSARAPATLVIASRESRLALWQAEHVRDRLAALYPDCQITILGMTTRGDRILDRTLSQVGGKGLFVKELETAILDGRADLAVHCLKDVPMDVPDGFAMCAVLERHEARDAFVSNDYASLEDLPAGAVVGTSSLRRQALIAARYPHLVIQPLRGNLDTRLAKLDAGQYAAIILAAAGLQRLGLESRIRMPLDVVSSLPAAAQGALAIEILAAPRKDGVDLAAVLAPLNHLDTERAVTAERKVAKVFNASCQIPMAAHATITGALMHLRAMVATPDGLRSAYAELEGDAATPGELGQRVADLLAIQDAGEILDICRQQAAGGA